MCVFFFFLCRECRRVVSGCGETPHTFLILHSRYRGRLYGGKNKKSDLISSRGVWQYSQGGSRWKRGCSHESRLDSHLLLKEYFAHDYKFSRFFLFSNLLWYIKMESFEYQLTLRLVTRRTTLFLHTPLFFFFRFTVRSKLLDFKVLFDMYFLYRQSPNGWPQRLLLMKGSREQWIYKPHFIKIRSHFMDSIMHKGASVPWWVFVPHRYTTRGHQRDVLRCASKCCAAT